MKHIELNGQVREAGNKAAVKAIRRAGQVPCNIYGLGLENILFTIDAQDLKTITHTPNSFIITLSSATAEAVTQCSTRYSITL